MVLPTVRKEDMLSQEEDLFAKAIRKIEDLMMTEEENLIFFHIYLEAVVDLIEVFIESSKKIEKYPVEKEFLFHSYAKGAKDVLNLLYWKTPYVIDYGILKVEKRLLFQTYIHGIEDIISEFTKGIRIDDVIRITRDINSYLADIEEKHPEEIWEGIRNRVGLT